MSRRASDSRELGKGFALFAIAFALFTAVVAMLAQVGLPDAAAAVLFALVTLLSFVMIGFVGRTMQLADFQVAGRGVPPVLNGMATAAAFIASGGFLGLAGAFFGGSTTVLAVIAGWTTGFLALPLLVAPYLRKAAAISVADFLAIRFESSAVRLAAVVVTVVCSFAFLAAEMAAAGLVASAFLGIGTGAGVGIALVVVLASSLFGGMRAVTWTAVAQYIVLAIAFVTPVAVLSLQNYDMPVPQLTYGYALEDVAASGNSVTMGAPTRFLPLVPLDNFNMVVLALSLAAGVASMPHVLMRSAASAGIGAARRAAGWALLFVAVILATAPAYVAFTRLALVVNPTVRPIDADTVVLGLPIVADMSPAMTALIAVGALAAILAAATALLFAIASTIGHDLYGGLLDRHGPPGRRLIVTRIMLIIIAGIAAWYAMQASDRIFTVAASSLSLAASGLFPALLLGIWWRRATAWGAFAGIVLGFAAGGAYAWTILHGGMTPWQPLGSAGTGLPAMSAAFFGVPVGLLTIVFVSQITAEPPPEQIEIVEAIRHPAPSPLFDE